MTEEKTDQMEGNILVGARTSKEMGLSGWWLFGREFDEE